MDRTSSRGTSGTSARLLFGILATLSILAVGASRADALGGNELNPAPPALSQAGFPSGCGATAAAMVLQYYGYPTSVSQAHSEIVDNAAIWDVASGINLLSDGGITTTYTATNSGAWQSTINNEVSAGRPLIVLIANGSDLGWNFTRGHYVVVRGFDGAGNVAFNDPQSGTRRTMSPAAFEAAWGDSGTFDVKYPWQYIRAEAVAKTGPAYPTARSLGVPDLGAWCAHLGYRGVTTVLNNAYGLRCATNSSGGLATFSVLDACKFQFNNPGAVDSYRDFNNAYNWECYDLGPSLGKPNLASYCTGPLHGSGLHLHSNDAYGIWCTVSGTDQRFSVTQACQWQFGRSDVVDRIRDFYDPENWLCYIIK